MANRNDLMHPAMPHQSVDDNTILKTSRQGRAIMSLQPLSKTRRVADDMQVIAAGPA